MKRWTGDFVKFGCVKLCMNDKGKKTLVGMQKWKDKDKKLYTREQYKKMYNPNTHKVVCVVTGKINNITVIDFDKIDEYYEAIEKYPQLKDAYTVETSKGFHIYCKYNKNQKTTTNTDLGIDIRNDDAIAFGVGTKTEFNTSYDLLDNAKLLDVEMPMELYLKIVTPKIVAEDKPKQNKIIVKKANTSQIQAKQIDKSCQLLDLIDIKYWDDFESWKRIVWAMKEEEYSMEVAKEFSQKSSNYDIDGFSNIWNKSPSNITISQGTINYYAKISDENKYYKIARSHKMTDDDVMDINKFYEIQSEMVMPDSLIPNNFNDLNKSKQQEINEQVAEFENEKQYDELNRKCIYFESFHFKVMNPPCFGRTSYNKTLLLNASEIELQYENVFVGKKNDIKWVKYWRARKYMRTFENVDFLPPPLECADYTMNTFNGLRAEKLPACDAMNVELLLKHIDILSGNDVDGSQYIINYLAHAVQKSGELPRVALVFQSDQGTGKNIFFENLVRKLFGAEYLLQTAEMDKVIGRFSMINNKLFIIMDETSGKDSFTNSDKIKNIITCEQIPWERKGIDGININNCGRYLFFSNNDTPVKIEASDRRYVVFKCSNERQNDSPYFKEMSKMFSDDAVIKTVYNYLLNVDISNWDSIHDRPITQAYKDIQCANIPPMAKWLEDRYYLNNAHIQMGSDKSEVDDHQNVKSNDLFQEYKIWLVENGFKNMEYNVTKFGRELKKFDGVEKKRKPHGMLYVFDFECLKKYLLHKKYLDE